MFIRSERLFLRPGWPEDWEEVLHLIDDEMVVRNLSRVPWPYSGDDARAFLNLPQELRLPRLMVTLPGVNGARIVGCAGLGGTTEIPELGYWIARDYWGQGYASEAAKAVLQLARVLGHERIMATHFLDNPASGRVLEKVGFRRTGRVYERLSQARDKACPAREYEVVFDASGDCGNCDDFMRCRRAA
ncbi:MAG: GNAT family N-acetyltransferase [Novosphingobium sp.]